MVWFWFWLRTSTYIEAWFWYFLRWSVPLVSHSYRTMVECLIYMTQACTYNRFCLYTYDRFYLYVHAYADLLSHFFYFSRPLFFCDGVSLSPLLFTFGWYDTTCQQTAPLIRKTVTSPWRRPRLSRSSRVTSCRSTSDERGSTRQKLFSRLGPFCFFCFLCLFSILLVGEVSFPFCKASKAWIPISSPFGSAAKNDASLISSTFDAKRREVVRPGNNFPVRLFLGFFFFLSFLFFGTSLEAFVSFTPQ